MVISFLLFLIILISRECNFEHEQILLPFFRHYRNSDCNHRCYAEAVRRACRCILFFLPSFTFLRNCDLTDIPCISNIKSNMSTWLTTELCNCPRDCVSRKYRASMNIGNFLAIPYMIESQNPYINLTFNESTSILNFFFGSSIYVKQKQETVMSIISLVSNLGGVFGLFLGFSGISLLEIYFYFYKGIRGYLRSRRNRRRQIAADNYS